MIKKLKEINKVNGIYEQCRANGYDNPEIREYSFSFVHDYGKDWVYIYGGPTGSESTCIEALKTYSERLDYYWPACIGLGRYPNLTFGNESIKIILDAYKIWKENN